jgi:hypothetical protein
MRQPLATLCLQADNVFFSNFKFKISLLSHCYVLPTVLASKLAKQAANNPSPAWMKREKAVIFVLGIFPATGHQYLDII